MPKKLLLASVLVLVGCTPVDLKTIDNKDYVCYYKRGLLSCYEVGREVKIKEQAIFLESKYVQ